MVSVFVSLFFFFFNDTATTEIYTLSLHDALPISSPSAACRSSWPACSRCFVRAWRSVTSSSMIKSRAMSPDSSLRQQSLGEVHALLELAEPALHVVERLREARNVGLGESPPGALV